MNSMRLQMIVSGNNSGLNSMLSQSNANIQRFVNSASSHFSNLQTHASRVWSAINGLSAATKWIGAGIGLAGMKSVLDDNLAFERTLLKIKFNAQMTTKELAELRKMAMDLSKSSLNSPLEIVQMQMRLANAGLKMDAIRQLAPTVANAAQVFDAPANELADLVFDKITKTGIGLDRVPQMLDMLYYHATSGRFETMDMARQAPEFLNAGALVGLNNEKGLNLLGALTQRMMRNATVANPSEVSTLIKHGLSHITDPHYVKGLKKAGIDVKKYFDDKGHFKGEGGVEGLLALTRAMKDANLDNPFKLGKAGFREQYTKTFWLEMMRSLDAKDTDKDPNLIKMMQRGEEAMKGGILASNLAEIKQANFGKIKAAEIEIQKAKLSNAAQTATGAAGSLAQSFSDHPIATTGAVVGGTLAGKYLLDKLLRGRSGALGNLAGRTSGAGVPVIVTNWPSLLGGSAPPRQIPRLLTPTLTPAASAAGGAAVGRTLIARAAATTAIGAAIVGIPLAVGYLFNKWQSSKSGQEANTRRWKFESGQLERRINIAKESGDKELIEKLAKRRAILQKKLDDYLLATSPNKTQSTALQSLITEPAKTGNANRQQAEIAQLDHQARITKSNNNKELQTALEKQRIELSAKLDNVIQELNALNGRPVQVNLDSRPIVAAVNTANGRDAKRQ